MLLCSAFCEATPLCGHSSVHVQSIHKRQLSRSHCKRCACSSLLRKAFLVLRASHYLNNLHEGTYRITSLISLLIKAPQSPRGREA
jgi:hypothetical protein